MAVTPESIRERLADSDFGERLQAVNQIRDLEPEPAFELLQIAIADSNARVRYAAVSQLPAVGLQNRDLSLSVLRQCLLTDSESDVRAAAADSLAAMKLTEAFEDLETVYNNIDEWLVQFSIIAALGELGDPRAFDLLQRALESDVELIFTAAIGSLGELADPRALPLLLNYINHVDWHVRHRLVQALSNFDHPDAKAALTTLSQDEVTIVADNAKHYLNAS